MNFMPPPDSRQYEAQAELKIREEQRKRGLNTYPEDTSNTSGRKQLSRRAIVLIRLTVILLIIVGTVILYRLIF
jgi:hypothetical protein